MENLVPAQDLSRRLNERAVDVEPLARDAVAIFDAAGSPVHLRWLALELHGYGSAIDHAPLHDVLGVPEAHPLVSHVSAYRAQQGHIQGPARRPFRHFFIESLHDLSDVAQRARTGVAGDVRLDFAPGVPDYPAAAIFPGDVFDRILVGFRAALHRELESLTA